jgi:hypothetical protein
MSFKRKLQNAKSKAFNKAMLHTPEELKEMHQKVDDAIAAYDRLEKNNSKIAGKDETVSN